MEPQNDTPNIKQGATKSRSVTLRSKRDNKDISKEPEMKELKRMIREGELDPDRTLDHLENQRIDQPAD